MWTKKLNSFLLSSRWVALSSLFVTACLHDDATQLTSRPSWRSQGACHDFYQVVNRAWLTSTQLAPDQKSKSMLTEITEANESLLLRTLQQLLASQLPIRTLDQQKLRDFYLSMQNADHLEHLGLAPLAAELDEISAINSSRRLLETIVNLQKIGVESLLTVNVYSRYPGNYALIGLAKRPIDTQRAATLFTLAGMSPAQLPQASVALKNIATAFERQATLSDNNGPSFDVSYYLHLLGIPASKVEWAIKADEINAVLSQTSLQDWHYLLTYRLLEHFAWALPKRYHDPQDKTPALERIWSVIPNIIDQFFISLTLSDRAVAKATEIAQQVRAALAKQVGAASWLSETGRSNALIKINATQFNLANNLQTINHSSLAIVPTELIGNIKRASQFYFARKLSWLDMPAVETSNSPSWKAGAHHSEEHNTVFVSAGLMQPPLFSVNHDQGALYGGLGAIIGHEMGHGLASFSQVYPRTGQAEPLFTEVDSLVLHTRSGGLIQQFEQTYPGVVIQLPGMEPLDISSGTYKLFESFPDLVGVSAAYQAFIAQKRRYPLGSEKFFVAWARAHRQRMTQQAEFDRLKTDPHPPGPFRVNAIFANLPQFAQTFGCQLTDPLFRPAEQRVAIW